MRYLNTDQVSFVIDGTTATVNDIRPIPTYTTRETINIREGEFLDEIATRKNVFGPDSEISIYTIFEHNALDLFENHFNLWDLKTINIPNR
jgi:hypothetical protein